MSVLITQLLHLRRLYAMPALADFILVIKSAKAEF